MTSDVMRRRRRKLTVFVAALATALGLTVAGITQAGAADTLLSQGKTATASSQEGADVGAAKAFDGDNGTRWSSQFSDPQWIQVDLGTTASINQMPNQAAWMNGSTRGYAAYKVADSVNDHQAWGLGSYCVFTLDLSVVGERAFEVPVKPGIRFTNMVTVSLGGQGTINRIINDKGGTARSGAEIQYLTTGP
jgi:hypothetical protein